MSRLQLEIVADNKTVAAIANGVARISNDFYGSSFDRIRPPLLALYRDTFEYKAKFLDPVDWRPREYNKAADHVANCILEAKCDVQTFTDDGLTGLLKDAPCRSLAMVASQEGLALRLSLSLV